MADGLGISNHSEVYITCKPVSVHWRDLGARLGVLVNALDDIEADCGGKVQSCMSSMLEKWLRRPVGEVCDGTLPTWRSLCKALSYIDRPLAEAVSVEHGCNYISPVVSEVTSRSDVSPAFLPQSCGCGKCTIKGWMTGRMCQNLERENRPKLLIVNPEHPVASDFIKFERNYDRQARLCSETSYLVSLFDSLSLDTWKQLKFVVDSHTCNISDIVFYLSVWLKKPMPMISHLHELQSHSHLIRVSWFNFRPLFFLAQQFLNQYPDLLANWNNYLAIFREYCSSRNLKGYVNVFFQVEEHNVFLLEVDERYYNFTLSDIESLCDSLSIALKCPSVCLHLVTVRGGSLIIYLHYCYSDYLTVFQSLTTEQLKKISQIKAYRILSLTDLHSQFRYDNIQSYAEAPPPRRVSISATDNATVKKDEIDACFESTYEEKKKDELQQVEVEILKKQSQFKDADLSRTIAELSVARTDIKKQEEETQELRRQLHSREAELVGMIKRQKELNASLSKDNEELKISLKSNSLKLQEVTQRFQKVAPVEYVKEMSCKPVKTITGLNRPRGVAVCDNGDIVVTERDADRVTIVNKEGKKLKSLCGEQKTKEGQFTRPRGVAVSNDGHILVIDEHRLRKFTFDGVCVQSVGNSESGSGQLQFKHPKCIAVQPTSRMIFVADSGNNRIQVFNNDLTFSHTIISIHDEKEFNTPYDVSLDSEGCLYVAEFGDHCITKLTATGQYITRFGSYGYSPGQLYFPSSLTINNNLVYVSEWDNHRVSVFDTKGTFLHCFGKGGSGEGEFVKPLGITTDTFGNLYVCDTHNNRIVVF